MQRQSDKSNSTLVFSGELGQAGKRQIQRLAQEGKALKLYQGIYCLDAAASAASIVVRHWPDIVSYLLPGALLSYRSAVDTRPMDGVLYLTRGQRRYTIDLPGLRLEIFPGIVLTEEGTVRDAPYKSIFLASEPRWLLENLSQGRGLSQRTLSQEAIEEHLEKLLTIRGEYRLNTLRDQARTVADRLQMQKQFARLDALIGALLGSHEKKTLRSRQALARAAGKPYDPERIELFDVLFAQLRAEVLPDVPDKATAGKALETFAFFEAYFSNFIEGTTFEIEEAEKIIFEHQIIPNRNEDSHDVLGTFRAATNKPWRNQPPRSEEDFLAWLKTVNALVMEARPDKTPGQWKQKANQAGSTLFVHPELVPGTLRQGFARIGALEHPLARALMSMFVVTEVHPFADGNGRTARLIMNSELSAGGLSRIIIPTVYREDYLLPLKALSNNKDPAAFIRMMSRIQQWTAAFDYTLSRGAVQAAMESCNAFREDLRNYRLIFPG